jgi:hypothetical protein
VKTSSNPGAKPRGSIVNASKSRTGMPHHVRTRTSPMTTPAQAPSPRTTAARSRSWPPNTAMSASSSTTHYHRQNLPPAPLPSSPRRPAVR